MPTFSFNINAQGKDQVLQKTGEWCSEINNQHTPIPHSHNNCIKNHCH